MNQLYIISDGSGLYKIGITSGSVLKRMAQLQTGNGRKLTLVASFVLEGISNEFVESWIHQQYREYQAEAGNEWFKLDETLLEEVKKDVSKFEKGECEVHRYQTALVRSVRGNERLEVGVDRKSLLVEGRFRCDATDQHLLGTISRKHEICRKDVLRQES
jgi:hypothetical protein